VNAGHHIARFVGDEHLALGQHLLAALGLRDEKYLPRLAEQSQADYDAYRARGSFFNATARSLMR